MLLIWENEAFLALDEFGKDTFEIRLLPSRSSPNRSSRCRCQCREARTPRRWPRNT